MKTAKLDDKFSIVYDDENNDMPKYIERCGNRHANIGPDTPNWVYVLCQLAIENQQTKEN